MKRYRVRMTARPDGGGSEMAISYNAYSPMHAMQLAAIDYPGWTAVDAWLD
jgi:hypothetical protein